VRNAGEEPESSKFWLCGVGVGIGGRERWAALKTHSIYLSILFIQFLSKNST
jgi:hypothetical protein